MIYKWYFIFNYAEFVATGLVSRTYSVILSGIGAKDILVTQGNYVGLTYDGTFLAIGLNDKNPLEFDSMAVYKDESDNVFLGFLQADE